MQQFINWGGETPEQIAERRRFEEEMREFMINKMLMEAAQNGARSANAAIGGGGIQAQVEVTQKTGLILYYSETSGNWEFFTMNPASLTFSDTVILADILTADQFDFNSIYPLNQGGYVLEFNNADSSKTLIFVSANGSIIDHITTAPTNDFNSGIGDGKIFYCTDFDDRKMWLFDGTKLRLDETILADATGLNIGSGDDRTIKDGKLILNVSRTDLEIGDYRTWYLADTESSTVILEDYYTESGATVSLIASHTSNYIIVDAYEISTNNLISKAIINSAGDLVWFEELSEVVNTNNIFYGTLGSIVLIQVYLDRVEVRAFDQAIGEMKSIDWIKPDQNSQFNLICETASISSVNANTPSESFAIVFYTSLNNNTTGNLDEVSDLAVITKFAGQDPILTELPSVQYVNIYNVGVADDVILLPISEDFTYYEIIKATRTSKFESIVDNIQYQIDSIDALNFDRAANGFILEVADGSQEMSIIHMINRSGECPSSAIFGLPGENYNNNSNWVDESGPLLYYINNEIRAWLPDLADWQFVGPDSGSRYSTRNYSNPGYLDGSNYFLLNEGPRLYWFTDQGTNTGNIEDGGNDMYDQANELYAGPSETQNQILYTHTQISNNSSDEITDSSLYLIDGTVQSGAGSSLGQASEYFTNCYPGLFVMSAMGVETTRFAILGNIGADGGGQADAGKIELTQPGYTLFYKRVWGAGDPSINQLIIVKSTDSDQIAQSFDPQTDNDDHVLNNLDLAEATQIHYLLFALANGNIASLDDITALANAYVALIKNETSAEDVLTLINQNYETLLTNVPPHIPNENSTGKIISTSSINSFEVSGSAFESILIGSNGIVLVAPNSSEAFDILHHDINGRLISRVETDLYRFRDSYYVDDRAIVILAKEGDLGWETTVFIFNEDGYSSKQVILTEGYEFSLNDIVWWD